MTDTQTPVTPPAAKPVYDWDTLLPSTDAPAHIVSTGTKVDVIRDVPLPVRMRVEGSLIATILAKVEWVTAGRKVENFKPVWKLQPVADEAQGKEFVKLVTKYAKYRPQHWEQRDTRTPEGQITVRTGAPTLVKKDPVSGADVETPYWAVRYQAKVLEAKKDTARVPGSAK